MASAGERWAGALVWLLACGGSPPDDGGANGSTGTTAAEPGPTTSTGDASEATDDGPASTGATTSTSDDSADDTSGDGTTGGEPELPPFCDEILPTGAPDEWQSSVVWYEGDRLQYASDDEGNRIPDFSYAGYHHGELSLPDVPMVASVGPVDGDDTASLQAAIDAVGARPRGADGFRGALVLEPGTYQVAGTLLVPYDGVVLRGAGDGDDPATDTILQGVGNSPNQRTIVVLGSGDATNWGGEVPGSRRDIVTPVLPVGSMSLQVDDPSSLSVGDNVVLEHPDTQAWLDAHDGGATGSDAPWQPGEIEIRYSRHIEAIEGDTITLDAPIFDHFDTSLSQASLYVTDRAGIVTEVGIESLRIDIETAGGEDEAHAWNGIGLVGVEDAWVRDVTVLHFGYAGVRMATASRVTVEDVRALDPVSIVEGGKRYNFAADRATGLALVRDCTASFGRHHFVSNGTSSVAGVVFHRCESQSAYTSSEGHRRWSQGLLFDLVTETGGSTTRLLGLYNRGDYGTGHGWSSAHSVTWGYDLGSGTAVIQKPPRAQNYAIGGAGDFDGNPPFPGPAGHVENQAGTLVPRSLYEAQLCDRLRGR